LSSRTRRCARRERLVDLREGRALDLDRPFRLGAPRRARLVASPTPPASAEWFSLTRDRVEEPHPVVHPAAGGHGLLLERPHPRASSCACPSICAPVPSTSRTKARRQRGKRRRAAGGSWSATLSAVRMPRAGPSICATGPPSPPLALGDERPRSGRSGSTRSNTATRPPRDQRSRRAASGRCGARAPRNRQGPPPRWSDHPIRRLRLALFGLIHPQKGASSNLDRFWRVYTWRVDFEGGSDDDSGSHF